MAFNTPSGQINNISFGPAKVYLGTYTSGSATNTPTVDVGYISEDGVSIELVSEKKNINQGNPYLIEYSFIQSQTAMIKFSSIQWNMNAFVYALGAGVTAYVDTAGSNNYGGVDCALQFAFGGDPINKTACIHIKHEAAVSSNTISIYGWKVQSESGFTMPFNTDEATFEYSFNCIRSDTNWANQPLAREEQLMAVTRELTAKQSYNFADDGGPGRAL
tara:strand:- start:2415 stop:3068 length:654 start_codon:yes stop_codon:yes gene_type:complete